MILHRWRGTDSVWSVLPGSGGASSDNFVEMQTPKLGCYPSSRVDLEDSGDDSDGQVVELVDDPMLEKIKAYSDTQLDDEIAKYEGYVTNPDQKALRLTDGGAKLAARLKKLQQVKSARAKQRSPVAFSQKSQDTESSDDFSPEPGAVGDWQTRCGRRSTAQAGLSRGLGTCSTVKTEGLFSPSGSALYEPFKYAACNNGKSVLSSEIISQSPSPERTTCSLERVTRLSSGEQAGPSSRELSTPNQFDQSEGCSVCRKSSFLSSFLSNVPGRDGLLCSMCRRKAKTPDPSFQLDSDLKTPSAKPIGRNGRYKRTRGPDVVGRTPDTAMEIDSSDEDEMPSAGNGFTPKDSYFELPRRMGLRGNLRRRMEGYKVKIAYPSRTDPDAVEILPADLKRLDPMEFLNDTVIDFYIKYIQRDEFLSVDGRQRFHFFNSFFYKKLSEVVSSQKKKGGADFSKLRKWTKGTNIFEKEYLFVPIHDKLHWSLAIICFPGCDKGGRSERCIMHLDSMTHGHDSQRVFRLLRSYLVAEWKHSVEAGDYEADECPHTLQSLKNDDIPCKKVPVPLQDNESDCGLFLLHYIQKFVEHAPKAMKLSDLEGNWEVLGVFGREWFHSTEASSLRTSIQEQLLRLFDQEQLDHQESMFGQGNKEEDKSDCSTTGTCEVVIPLDGEAS